MKWLKKDGLIHIEVPNAGYYVNSLVNFYYRLKGLDYVANISPMHEPYHLYEFTLESFIKFCDLNNYKLIDYKYFVCGAYNIPKLFAPILNSYMKATNTGMQLSVMLGKN